MDEQMEMVLKEGGIRDDGLNVDPVSGNEIPSGSLAEEVRDDIPAQLSGGEYVVPADVVRFFGVKYFEDLSLSEKADSVDIPDLFYAVYQNIIVINHFKNEAYIFDHSFEIGFRHLQVR